MHSSRTDLSIAPAEQSSSQLNQLATHLNELELPISLLEQPPFRIEPADQTQPSSSDLKPAASHFELSTSRLAQPSNRIEPADQTQPSSSDLKSAPSAHELSSLRSELLSGRSEAPPKIDPNDLKANGKLLNDEQIEFVKRVLQNKRNLTNCVFSKKKLKRLIKEYLNNPETKEENPKIKIPYRILKTTDLDGNDEYFAIYKGRKSEKALGVGGHNVVKAIQSLKTGHFYALRVVKAEPDEPSPATQFQRLQAAGKARGRLYRKKLTTGTLKNKYYMITELALGMDLFEHIKAQLDAADQKKMYMPTSEWLELCRSIIKTVRDFHQNRRHYHRDLKLENLMYDRKTKETTLIDFDFSCPFDPADPDVYSENAMGTHPYAAPEILSAKLYNEKTEVFALGIIFAKLLGFRFIDDFAQKPRYFNSTTRTTLHETGLDEQVKELRENMTHEDPQQRYSLKEAESVLSMITAHYLALAKVMQLPEEQVSRPSQIGHFSPKSKAVAVKSTKSEEKVMPQKKV